MLELVPQLLPQTVTGTCCRNEVAVATYFLIEVAAATYFLIEVAAATSHNHAYRAHYYGSGLRKFHLFCDIFTIPESDRLPASFLLLHSFARWTVLDPDMFGPDTSIGIPFKPVSIGVVRKYLSAI